MCSTEAKSPPIAARRGGKTCAALCNVFSVLVRARMAEGAGVIGRGTLTAAVSVAASGVATGRWRAPHHQRQNVTERRLVPRAKTEYQGEWKVWKWKDSMRCRA
ncbi:hypothetical protein AG1IA_08685 [Rhizoctonia solani AG-1 IA]|uniref:Uncharacterized protein n=1 Tax=Thanatephorus cucumeris (strain AG1-IA) TaxID=983506 RepID=L8WGK1_THACA|nr:hypothetical protein AG1IA_08685 [Rhizoctonia solani AG-1 IA]